ncbi:phosphate ABC transporter permease PstA [Natrinema sp. SYSU A 869]|uniref:phosphate ABC transporter permease PstA n=1 Tax=Natrinema sp. SYSU A 869 TaxID=2871694 RepID=UPI001CA3FD16|nr:phosphate ABC transporter permease PstA [Natrinema sp. SYSU A 869]
MSERTLGNQSRNPLAVEYSATLAGLSIVPIATFLVAFVIGGLTLAGQLSLESTVLGIGVETVLTILLFLAGGCVLAAGVSSRYGITETTPDRSAGLSVAVGFGFVAFSGIGLIASQTLGFGRLLWVPLGLVAGVVVAGATLFAREDLGVTIPAGLFSIIAGSLVLLNVLTPAWAWSPAGFGVTFSGTVFIPLLTIVTSFVAAWAAANALEGFGAAGRQAGAFFLIGANAALILLVLLLLIAFIVKNGFWYAVDGIEIGPGLHFHWPFVMDGYNVFLDEKGIYPAIIGTFWLVVGAVLMAVPIGVGAAVFLTEYAEEGRFTSMIDIATNGLWSTPSVVFGLFGYAFLVPRLGNNTSLLAGMIVLGFMLLPLVLITSREAIKSVPDEYRDASAALGVSKWETIKDVTIPSAMPGIVTGIIIGIGRIAGETAPILIVTADSPQRSSAPAIMGSFELTTSPPFIVNEALLSGSSALPYQLYGAITTGVVGDDPGYGWATAFILLLVVLSFYVIGITTRMYFRKKLQA